MSPGSPGWLVRDGVKVRSPAPAASDVRQLPTLAWQGWELTLPADWAPIKVDGNFDRGFVAIADLDRERLGLRWQTVGPKVDPRRVVDDNLRGGAGSDKISGLGGDGEDPLAAAQRIGREKLSADADAFRERLSEIDRNAQAKTA